MKFTGILCLTCTCISFLVIGAIGLRANLLIRRACRGRYTRRDSFKEFEMHSFFRSGYCINECNRLEGISDRWESGTEADGSLSFAAPRSCYDIFVSTSLGFLPTAQRVCVLRELRELRIKLKADPHSVLFQR